MRKEQLCTTVGMVGGFIAALLGGWDTGLQTLMILIGIDYLTGLIVAGVFHKSTKTKNGALESKAKYMYLSNVLLFLPDGICQIQLCSVQTVPTPLF